jgi:hypothetical protein
LPRVAVEFDELVQGEDVRHAEHFGRF